MIVVSLTKVSSSSTASTSSKIQWKERIRFCDEKQKKSKKEGKEQRQLDCHEQLGSIQTNLDQGSGMTEVVHHLSVLSRTRSRLQERRREDDRETLRTHAWREKRREKNETSESPNRALLPSANIHDPSKTKKEFAHSFVPRNL